jgi:asparagine synthase (glutamine-hydrolysing)
LDSTDAELLAEAAGAFGVELRFPFWDRRLVEFCLALPPEQKLSRGWTRMVLRRAMDGILPESIQWRGGKADLSTSFLEGLLTFERERLERLLAAPPPLLQEYVDLGALQQIYRRFTQRKASRDEAGLMWRAVSLALWLQQTGLTP